MRFRPSVRPLLFGLLATVSVIATARAAPTATNIDLYRQAYAQATIGLWDQAWSIANRADDPFLAKLLLWIELVRDPPQARFEQYRDFLEQNPTWPDRLLMRAHAETKLKDESDATAADWFRRFPPVTLTAKLRQADLLLAAGNEAQGVARLRQIWVNDDFPAADERGFLARYGDYLPPQDQALRLDRLIWDGRYAAARRMLARVDPPARELGAARLALLTGAPDAKHLLEMVPPSLDRDPGLIFARVRWRQGNGHYDGAAALLDQAPANPGHARAWITERRILARVLLTKGKPALAYRVAALNGLSGGPAFADLEFLAGWVALRYLHDPAEGYHHFVRLYDHTTMPVSRARGAYWAARAAAALNRPSDADSWYRKAAAHPLTYYGQLAAAATHDPGIGSIPAAPEVDPAQIRRLNSNELAQAARDLVAMGDGADARPFLALLIETATSPIDDVAIARLAARLRRPDMEIFAARRAAKDGIDLFSANYPLVALPPGGGQAEPALILAMARQESAFDPQAVSPAGARGLMQLMPATAKKFAADLDLPFSDGRLTDDGSYNLRLGRAYLDTLLNRFNGSYVLAIAAYNAGPSRVQQWLDQFGDPRDNHTNAIDWIESLPIAETRNYLQRVLENLQIYRFRLGDHDLAFKLTADLRR
jgi:peptidoglycan lytic transglycosylase